MYRVLVLTCGILAASVAAQAGMIGLTLDLLAETPLGNVYVDGGNVTVGPGIDIQLSNPN